jgi:hypothetical protein
MTQASHDDPQPEEIWGCISDSSEIYQLTYSGRTAALEALEGQSGALVRCRRGFPREGLEYPFDLEMLLGRIEERAEASGQVIADFEQALFDPTPPQEDDLRRRLADALHDWIESMNPPCWVIVESEDIEVPTNAQNSVP